MWADKKVFPNFYVLGWYSTGTDAQESDMLIHKAVSNLVVSVHYFVFSLNLEHSIYNQVLGHVCCGVFYIIWYVYFNRIKVSLSFSLVIKEIKG